MDAGDSGAVSVARQVATSSEPTEGHHDRGSVRRPEQARPTARCLEPRDYDALRTGWPGPQ